MSQIPVFYLWWLLQVSFKNYVNSTDKYEISIQKVFTGRDDAKAPILRPFDANNWLIGKDLDAGKAWRQKEKRVAEDETVSSYHVNLSKLQEIVEDKEAWRAAVHGVTKSQTWLSNWTELNLLSLTHYKWVWMWIKHAGSCSGTLVPPRYSWLDDLARPVHS